APALVVGAGAIAASPRLTPRTVERAEAHGVAPLVVRSLERLGAPGVPEDAAGALDAAWRLNAARNMLAARVLGRVLELLGRSGIAVIPLKGLALAESLYGDASLRVSSDIDILVRRRDVPGAFRLFEEQGFARADMEPEVDAADLDWLLESNMEYGFVAPEPPQSSVELHWDIAWRWRADAGAVTELWEESHVAPF